MKDKILKFIKERKELFIFLGVILVIFTAVITIAELTGNKSMEAGKTHTSKDPIENTTTAKKTTTTTTKKIIIEKMARPIESDSFEIVRFYFDITDVGNLKDAVIQTGNVFENSRGVSYAKLDKSTFDVKAVFSGTVKEIINDEIKGMIVIIEHENGLLTTYSSLSSINVNVNDKIVLGDTIGVAGANEFDKEAAIHVHLEISHNDIFYNALNCYDKTISEIINSK